MSDVGLSFSIGIAAYEALFEVAIMATKKRMQVMKRFMGINVMHPRKKKYFNSV